MQMKTLTTPAVALTLSALAQTATADEIDFLCYQDGTECDVIAELSARFTEETGHVVNTNIVSYEVIRDQLLKQLQAGDAVPDLARVTDLGGMAPYFLDIAPYVDSAYYEANFAATLPWMRPAGDTAGIYGWPGMGATGPFVNLTMFEDAGVDVPEAGATWDVWVTALTEVKDTLGLDAAFALDRTAHRWAGPAFSFGAKFMDDTGEPILVDDGFRTFAELFIDWHKSGFMPVEGWPAGSGTSFRNAAPLFLNGQVAMHFGGSWLINSYDSNITDFDWKAVPVPCGEGGCGAMVGGPAVAGFKSTDHPEAVAKFIDFMAREDIGAEYHAKTQSIPAHAGLQQAGIEYQGASARVADALNVFADNALKAATTTPQAFAFQGYPKNFVIYGVVPDYLTKAINGEMSLDEALAAIDADVKAKIAE